MQIFYKTIFSILILKNSKVTRYIIKLCKIIHLEKDRYCAKNATFLELSFSYRSNSLLKSIILQNYI